MINSFVNVKSSFIMSSVKYQDIVKITALSHLQLACDVFFYSYIVK